MKIVSIETTAVYVPYRPEAGTVVTAGMTSTGARHLLVTVRTDEGLTGVGEGVPRPSVYGETLQSVAAAIETLLAPPIIGLDPADVEKVWSRWTRVIGNVCAKAAIDMALHDIVGQRAGLPIYKLLGGWSTERIPLTWAITLASEAEMVGQATKAVEEGYRSIKVKVGKDPRADVRTVSSIRRAIGEEVMLYVDANMAYPPSTAMRLIRQFEEYGVELVEEPVANWDVDGRARIARSVQTPLLLDESIVLLSDVLREITLGSAGALSLRAPRYGFTIARKVAALAEAANVPCLVGSHRELGIGVAASAHISAGFQCVTYPAELGTHVLLEDGLLSDPLRIEGGYLYLPEGPGLGVRLDPKKVARYRL